MVTTSGLLNTEGFSWAHGWCTIPFVQIKQLLKKTQCGLRFFLVYDADGKASVHQHIIALARFGRKEQADHTPHTPKFYLGLDSIHCLYQSWHSQTHTMLSSILDAIATTRFFQGFLIGPLIRRCIEGAASIDMAAR
jgi:hypothetical protein